MFQPSRAARASSTASSSGVHRRRVPSPSSGVLEWWSGVLEWWSGVLEWWSGVLASDSATPAAGDATLAAAASCENESAPRERVSE
jgi:hypothetical protein